MKLSLIHKWCTKVTPQCCAVRCAVSLVKKTKGWWLRAFWWHCLMLTTCHLACSGGSVIAVSLWKCVSSSGADLNGGPGAFSKAAVVWSKTKLQSVLIQMVFRNWDSPVAPPLPLQNYPWYKNTISEMKRQNLLWAVFRWWYSEPRFVLFLLFTVKKSKSPF